MNGRYQTSRYLGSALLGVIMAQHPLPTDAPVEPPSPEVISSRVSYFDYALFRKLTWTQGVPPEESGMPEGQIRVVSYNPKYQGRSWNSLITPESIESGIFSPSIQHQNQKALSRNSSVLRTQGVPPPEIVVEAIPEGQSRFAPAQRYGTRPYIDRVSVQFRQADEEDHALPEGRQQSFRRDLFGIRRYVDATAVQFRQSDEIDQPLPEGQQRVVQYHPEYVSPEYHHTVLPPNLAPEDTAFRSTVSYVFEQRKYLTWNANGVPPADVAAPSEEGLNRRAVFSPRTPYGYQTIGVPGINEEIDELDSGRRSIAALPARPYPINRFRPGVVPGADVVAPNDELLGSRRSVTNGKPDLLRKSTATFRQADEIDELLPRRAIVVPPPRVYSDGDFRTAFVPPADVATEDPTVRSSVSYLFEQRKYSTWINIGVPPADVVAQALPEGKQFVVPFVPTYVETSILQFRAPAEVDELLPRRYVQSSDDYRRSIVKSWISNSVPPADVVVPVDELISSRRVTVLGKPAPPRKSFVNTRQPAEIDELLPRRVVQPYKQPYKAPQWVFNLIPADFTPEVDELLSSRRVVITGKPGPLRKSFSISRQPTEVDETLKSRRAAYLPWRPYKSHTWRQVPKVGEIDELLQGRRSIYIPCRPYKAPQWVFNLVPPDFVPDIDELQNGRRVVVLGKPEPLRESTSISRQPTEIDELLQDRRKVLLTWREYKPEPWRLSQAIFRQPDEIDELLQQRRGRFQIPYYQIAKPQFLTNPVPGPDVFYTAGRLEIYHVPLDLRTYSIPPELPEEADDGDRIYRVPPTED